MSLIATVLGSGVGGSSRGCGAREATRDFVSVARATTGGLVELRLDAWAQMAGGSPSEADVRELVEDTLASAGLPVVVACPATSSAATRGADALYSGEDSVRVDWLLAAARAGAAWVDIDVESLPALVERLAASDIDLGSAKVLLSSHFVSPLWGSEQELEADFDLRLSEILAACESLGFVGGFKLVAHCAQGDELRAGEHGLVLLRWLRRSRGLWRERGLKGVVFGGGAGGAFTRTLSPALGSDFVFAAADGGSRVTGQPLACELAATWPGGYPTERTRLFGVLGSPVASSLSPQIFTALFREHKIDAVFGRFDVPNPAAAFAFAELKEVCGISVTAPHKGRAQKFAFGELDGLARRIGAANTLTRNEESKWLGANTDVAGVRVALGIDEEGLPENKQAVVIGAGGAARAALGALCGERSGRVTVLARSSKAALALAREFGASVGTMAELDLLSPDILVHTTSAGSSAQPGVLAIEKQQLVKLARRVPTCIVLDAIYRPRPTPLIELATELGLDARDGMGWFLAQARAQFQWFTGEKARAGVAESSALEGLQSPWIALIGPRASGKSTVGKLLAERLGVPFVDLDTHLATRVGADSAGAHLLDVGEARFREDEADALRDALLGTQRGVLATGGGVVEHARSRGRLAMESVLCVRLTVSPEEAAKRMSADSTLRPRLSQLTSGLSFEIREIDESGDRDPLERARAEAEVLQRRRDPMFASLASITLDTHGSTAAELALTAFEKL